MMLGEHHLAHREIVGAIRTARGHQPALGGAARGSPEARPTDDLREPVA